MEEALKAFSTLGGEDLTETMLQAIMQGFLLEPDVIVFFFYFTHQQDPVLYSKVP